MSSPETASAPVQAQRNGPSVSPAIRERLVQAVAELRLNLSNTQIDALLNYLQLLERWNSTYNLTAVRKLSDMVTQHLADCLAVVGPLRRVLGEPVAARMLDVGSGAGLPGVVLAIAEPQASVLCVDKVGKKVAFIRQVAAELDLANLQAEHARVETLNAGRFDVVMSRAYDSLAEFTGSTLPHLSEHGVWLAMKGKRPGDELSALPAAIDVFHVEPLRIPGMDAQRCLVWMRGRQ
jgi:16S rRNA (guanine527-N7)-methyltransferase